MLRNVVTIARTIAAGGEEIGVRVAERLQFRYVDDEIIVRAANRAGVSPEEIAAAERTAPLLQRILESLGRPSLTEEAEWTGADFSYYQEPRYEALIIDVIKSLAKETNVVIVAHGGGMALMGWSDVMRVLITASPEVRVQRLMQARNFSQREAQKAVQISDRERNAYFRRFYGRGPELLTSYDLIVNTDNIDPAQAAALIADSVLAGEPAGVYVRQ